MAFGKGKEVKRLPNSQDILNCVSELEIYEMYLGELPRRAISSPFREDTSPSFSLFYAKQHGKVFFKDFGTGEVGDCFLFVMRLLNLRTKSETFIKIASDFGLNQFETNPTSWHTSPQRSIYKRPSKTRKLPTGKVRISVTVRPWKIRDKMYWQNKYGLNKAQLEYCNVYPISHYFINGYCRKAHDLAYAFVEEKDGVQTFKIYQPKADKEDKWINNNDFSTWELWTQLPKTGNILIVTSSRKDAMVIKSLFPSHQITSCSLQSEGVNPKNSVVDELKGRFKEIFVMYDNDFKSSKNNGRLAGQKLADQTGFLQIEIPDGCEVKDPSDYIEEFDRESLKSLILRLVKNKLREEELKQIQ